MFRAAAAPATPVDRRLPPVHRRQVHRRGACFSRYGNQFRGRAGLPAVCTRITRLGAISIVESKMTETILISGADKGLGYSLVSRFLHGGFHVFAGVYL